MNQKEKNRQLWEAIMQDMKLRGGIGECGFEAYISKLSLRTDTGTRLILEYQEEDMIDWVKINYLHVIEESVKRVLGDMRHIDFIQSGGETTLDEQLEAEATLKASQQQGTRQKHHGKPRPPHKRMNSGLNADFTFDSFVVGPNSEFAYNAALSIVESPCGLHNPLVISGGPGMGKTHLMQAIGNEILRRDENAQVLYVTSEDFTNAYIEAIMRNGEGLSSFRRKYRKADVLLIDDVQFLADKDKTQAEFFHTFNSLLGCGKQIVMTMDCSPTRLTTFDPRLTSRFEQGLNVALNAPELETRIAILRVKRNQWKSNLISDEVINFIASNITCSVRRMEGAMIRLGSLAAFTRSKPSIQEAKHFLKDFLDEERKAKSVSVERIQEAVAQEFGIRVVDLNGRSRIPHVAHPRQVAMYLARQHTQLSLKEIGEAFGGRDHGTVIHASKSVETRMAQDPAFKERLGKVTLSF